MPACCTLAALSPAHVLCLLACFARFLSSPRLACSLTRSFNAFSLSRSMSAQLNEEDTKGAAAYKQKLATQNAADNTPVRLACSRCRRLRLACD